MVIRVWSSAVGESEGYESVEKRGVENKGRGAPDRLGPRFIAHCSKFNNSIFIYFTFYLLKEAS